MVNYGLVYGGVGLVAAVLAAFLTEVSASYSWQLGIVDRPGPRKIHRQPIPLLGGTAIFGAFMATLLIGLGVAEALANASESEASWIPAQLMEATGHLPLGRLAVVLAGAVMMFFLGLADDIRGLSPWMRLAVEVVVASVVVMAGIRLQTPFGLPPMAINAIAIFWIVGIVNAMNLIDGADGLGAGIAMIASLGCCLEMLIINQPVAGLLLAILAGACVGFLVFNLPPARIFMGSSGSQFLGFMLAVSCLVGSELSFTIHKRFTFLFPLLMLAVPLYDTTTVVLLRLRRGHPLFKGDRRHMHHRLIRCGYGRSRAVKMIWLAALAIMLSGLAVQVLAPTVQSAIGITAVTLAASFGSLEFLAFAKLRRRIRDRRSRRLQTLSGAGQLSTGAPH